MGSWITGWLLHTYVLTPAHFSIYHLLSIDQGVFAESWTVEVGGPRNLFVCLFLLCGFLFCDLSEHWQYDLTCLIWLRHVSQYLMRDFTLRQVFIPLGVVWKISHCSSSTLVIKC